MKKKDSGRLFDNEQSPGYKESMAAFFKTLAPEHINRWDNMDYKKYTDLHETMIKYLPDNDWKEEIRNPWASALAKKMIWRVFKMAEDELGQQEQLAAFTKMENDRIKGIPLFTRIIDDGARTGNESDFDLIEEKPSEAMSVGIIYKSDQTIVMCALCQRDPNEGKEHIQNILELYNQKKEQKERSDYQILKDIAWASRAMHMAHHWRDANGRTNITGFVNEELIAAGFSPTILPHGPEVFGGQKTLNGLVEDMLNGMHSFIKEVDKQSISKLKRTQSGFF